MVFSEIEERLSLVSRTSNMCEASHLRREREGLHRLLAVVVVILCSTGATAQTLDLFMTIVGDEAGAQLGSSLSSADVNLSLIHISEPTRPY